MSYILEALRKSERERRLGRPPSLQSAVGDGGVPRHRVQWFVAVTLLLLLLSAVGILGWYRFGNTTPTLGPRVSTLTAKRPLAAADAAKPEQHLKQKNNQEPQQPAVSTPTSAQASEKVAAVVTSPTAIIEYINLEPALRARWPVLTLNVISYGKMVKQRFVMINQKIFKTGQTIQKDLQLEKIEADAVILQTGGLRFRLYPR